MSPDVPAPLSVAERALARRSIEGFHSFTCLDAVQIDNFISNLEERKFEAGQVIYEQGKRGANSLYIVVEGELEELDISNNNQSRHLQTLSTGQLFGVDAFLFGSLRSSTIKSLTPVRLWKVSQANFQQKVLDSPRIRNIYESYASRVDKSGSKVMDRRDLVKACSASSDPIAYAQIAALYHLFVNTKNSTSSDNSQPAKIDALSQTVSYGDFAIFSLFLTRPDCHFDVAFMLVDQDKRGYITLSDIKALMKEVNLLLPTSSANANAAFNFDCDVIRRFFGNDGGGRLRADQFSSFFCELQRETGRQSFMALLKLRKRENFGSVTGADLADILLAHGGDHSGLVADRIKEALLNTNQSLKLYTYSDYLAFQRLLSHLQAVASVIESALKAKAFTNATLSKDDYKMASKLLLDPLQPRPEVDAVFQLFDLDNDGFISVSDLRKVLGPSVRLRAVKGGDDKLTLVPPPGSSYLPAIGPKTTDKVDAPYTLERLRKYVLDFVEHFAIGAVAGALGSFCVYPIDLIKTRLQNQRSGSGPVDGPARPHYRGAFDCAKQVFLKEGGIRAFYRGIGPQLLGVAPEKAIKLAVNDMLRDAFTNPDKINEANRGLYLPLEILAGAGAGASQVVFTNPLEITKIRLQVQGETESMMVAAGQTPPPRKTAFAIVKELGVRGLYKGAAACLLRDVPFSAIYFPCYAAAKSWLASQTEDGKLRPHHMLIAGAIAGCPAAGCVTPFDVVKTRLQVVARTGEATYTGISDAFIKIIANEGFSALFRGALMRVARSSPQFGVTLVSYEMLHTALADPNSRAQPPTNAPVPWSDYDIYRRNHMEEHTSQVVNIMKPFGGISK